MNLFISSDHIIDYLTNKFKNDHNLCSDGREMVIPSIFLDYDPKKHMSINTETGLWQCFKTGNKGNFIYLVSLLEKKPYKRIYSDYLFKMLEDGIDVDKIERFKESNIIPEKIDLSSWIPVKDHPPTYKYLLARMIVDQSGFDFYYNKESNRLVIPYRSPTGSIFFFQERALLPSQQPKYLNYKGAKASTILYQYDVDSFRNLYICEGVFDAYTLKMLGYNATTTLSCSVSNEQLSQLKEYRGNIVVAYDNDEAGIKGLKRFDKLRKRMRMNQIYYCNPPAKYKDWNETLVKTENIQEIKDYVSNNTIPFDETSWEITQL